MLFRSLSSEIGRNRLCRLLSPDFGRKRQGHNHRCGFRGAFYLSAERDFLWLCAGEYRGIRTVKSFLRYCVARYKREQEEKIYRVYVTDALRLTVENTAKFAGGNYIKARYIDIVEPKKQDNRTCEEITADIIQRCGLVVKSE